MKIAVVGSRNFQDAYIRVKRCILKQKRLYGGRIIIITGGSGKVDRAAVEVALGLGLRCIIIPADWERYGTRAGPIRNTEIVKISDKIFAFWDEKSRGTMDVIKKGRKANKVVILRREENKHERA